MSKYLSYAKRLKYNSPVVGLVAVCVSRWRGFCKIPVDGRELSRHDKIVLVAMQKP